MLDILQGEWCMQIESWLVSGRLILEQKTNHSVMQPYHLSFLHKALCCAQSRTHAIQRRLCFADTLKVILSFRSCQGSAHVMHSFWALDAHILPSRRSRHLNKSKQRLLAFPRSGLQASYLLTDCPLHSPVIFISLSRAPAFEES